MGFLSFKRFFSLRHKEKNRRGEYGRPEAAKSSREATQPPTRSQRDCYLDEHAAFRSRSPGGRRKDRDGDDDAAVSRLLRSSSANYHVVAQTDFADLPPLPHPINTIASRSTSALTLTPSRTASLQAKGSYRVTVHKRQQLSTTIFPNAYPPQTPRRPGIAHSSTPDLLSTYSATADDHINNASTSRLALVDPRKVPVTPRDASRLNCLRQDPSVASLVRLYDDHGRLADNAFTNTPAPPRTRVRVRSSRRKSTFVELLGCEGTADANLAWAESCIARQNELSSGNSVSNASTSSLSSSSTPPLDSPATSTFNDVELDRNLRTPGPALKRDQSGSTITEGEKEEAFSSLVVELSTATSPGTIDSDARPAPYLGPYRYPQQKEKGKGKELVPVSDIDTERESGSKTTKDGDSILDSSQQDRTMGSKIGRRPSQRASQVFNFIGERRERRKSQELLQGPSLTIANSSEEPTRTYENAESATGKSLAVKPPSLSRARSPSPLMVDSNFNPRPRSQSTFAAPVRDVQVTDTCPAPSSPVTLRPLCPAPRPNGRSRSSTCSRVTGAAMVRTASSAFASTVSVPLAGSAAVGRQPAKGINLHAERGKEKAEAEQWTLPQTSTPHPSKVARAKSAMKVSFARHDHGMLGEVTNTKPVADYEDAEFDDASFEKRYSAFAASLDVRTEQLQRQMREKENDAQGVLKRRGAASDHGLTRSSTTTVATLSRAPASKHSHKHVHAYAQQGGPHTPIRSQSLRALEEANLNPPAASSSELSPATVQLMSDLRARKAFLRVHAERGTQAANGT